MDLKKAQQFAKKSKSTEDYGDEHEETDPGEEESKDEDKSDEEIVGEAAAQVAAGTADENLMALVEDYDPEQDGNPPEWALDEDVWEKAKKAVAPDGDVEGAGYDNGWAVVATVYKAMGGSF